MTDKSYHLFRCECIMIGYSSFITLYRNIQALGYNTDDEEKDKNGVNTRQASKAPQIKMQVRIQTKRSKLQEAPTGSH